MSSESQPHNLPKHYLRPLPPPPPPTHTPSVYVCMPRKILQLLTRCLTDRHFSMSPAKGNVVHHFLVLYKMTGTIQIRSLCLFCVIQGPNNILSIYSYALLVAILKFSDPNGYVPKIFRYYNWHIKMEVSKHRIVTQSAYVMQPYHSL